MECLYKTTTKYTLDEYKKYNNTFFMKTMCPVMIIVIIGFFLLGLLENSLVYIIAAILFPLICFIALNIGAKRVFNSSKVTQNADVTFEFYEDYFVCSHDIGENKIAYDKLYKIYETKTNFYLMIARNQGYILLKDNMPDGLEEFIKNIKIK